MTPKKTCRYSDPLKDDFAATSGKIDGNPVGEDYKYIHESCLWRLGSFLLYRVVALPLVYIALKVWLLLRVRGKKNLRGLKTGYFLFGNHTQNACDAYLPAVLAFPKRNYVITGPEAVNVPVAGRLTPMLGALPLNSSVAGTAHMIEAMRHYACDKRSVITVYPEAHIWPYCNFVRPFNTSSFYYPAKLGLPAVPFVVTYRERKIFRSHRPVAVAYIGKPVYPDPSCSITENRRTLREGCYEFMKNTAAEYSTAEYIRYVPEEGESGESREGVLRTYVG